MSSLDELREREHALAQSRTWAAHTSGTSGMPQQMDFMGLSNTLVPLAPTVRVDPTLLPLADLGETATLTAGAHTDEPVVFDVELAVPARFGFDGYAVPGGLPATTKPGYYDLHVRPVGSGSAVVKVGGATIDTVAGGERAAVPLGALAVGTVPVIEASGALTSVRATLQMVDRAVTGEPWAHYEPANLAGYANGDPVTVWNDTTLNGRNLTHPGGTTEEPTLVASALNGLPGIYLGGDNLNDVRVLRVDVAPEDVDRVTFLAVVAQIGTGTNNESSVVTMRGTTDLGLYFYREGNTSDDMSVSAADESVFFFDTSTTAPLNVAGGLLLEAERTPDGVTLKAGGTTVASDSTGFGTAPPAPASTISQLIIGDTGPVALVLCELVVFVTPEEHLLVGQYRALLKARWGL